MHQITISDIEKAQRYGQTRYAGTDVEKINAIMSDYEFESVVSEELAFEIQVWLAVFAPYWNNPIDGYCLPIAAELGMIATFKMPIRFENSDIRSQTGGSEMWPLSTVSKWTKSHKAFQIKVSTLWQAAKDEYINQSDDVSWWKS